MSGDWFKEWRESRWKQRVLRRYLDLSDPASVERLAAALYESDPPEVYASTTTDEYLRKARALIAALREPLP